MAAANGIQSRRRLRWRVPRQEKTAVAALTTAVG